MKCNMILLCTLGNPVCCRDSSLTHSSCNWDLSREASMQLKVKMLIYLWCISRSCTSDWFSIRANWGASLNSLTKGKKTLTAPKLHSLKMITEWLTSYILFLILCCPKCNYQKENQNCRLNNFINSDLLKELVSVFKADIISNWSN
jgi:hypothetical protein